MQKIFYLLLLFSFHTASAQINMVPNGSFEHYNICPTATAQLANAIGWGTYQNTPDYFNSCYSSSTIGVGVPGNKWGSENAACGKAYVGASFYSRRESFTRAITPLIPLRSYEISLSVSLADNSMYAVDGVGVHFFDRGPTSVSRNRILTPQVDFSSYGPVTTKTGWVRLTAYFVADSAYDNIVIGNFKSDSLLNVVTLSSGSISHAYYYFDSIVVKSENLALKYSDTALCTGDSLIVPYFVNSDSLLAGNIITLQLSDTSGSFVSGTTALATVAGRTSGVFRTVVPTTLPSGSSRYRIRIVSSNQPFSSRDNGKAISIGAVRISKPVAASNTPVCTADTLRLSATTTTAGTFNWSWKGPNNFTSTHQNPKIGNPATAAAGSYYATVYSYGCAARDTAVVQVKTSPTAIAASSSGTICEQDTLRLYSTASSSGVTYSWNGPGNFTSSLQNPIIASTSTTGGGKYYVTATVTNGCQRKDSVVVTVKPKPFVSASNSGPVCEGASLGLNATSSFTSATFAWNGPGGYISSTRNPTINSMPLGGSGIYTVTAHLNGCTDTGVTMVSVSAKPSITYISSNSPVCLLDTIKLFSIATAGVTYRWTGPSSFSDTTGNPFAANASTAHQGYYKLTVTTANGCTRTDSVHVTTKPLPVSYPSNTTPVCAGSPFGLNVTTTYTGVTFAWSGPNSFSSNSANPTISNPPASSSGMYTLTATLNGCTYTATTKATVHPIPVAKAAAQLPVCMGSTIQLIGNSFAGATYRWCGPSFSSTRQSPSLPATSTKQTGNYILVMTANGCVSEPDTVCVKVNVLPKIGGYVSPDDTICQGTIPTFVAILQDGGPAAMVQWYKNHAPVSNLNALKYAPPAVNSGDVYYCKLTAPGVCYNTTLVVHTDTIRMVVLPIVTKPSVEIVANPGLQVRPTDLVKFTAHMKHGGANPKYQWYKNGVKQTGAITATFDATGLSYMDMIHVDIISEDPCAQEKNASDTVWMQFPTAVNNMSKSSINIYPNPNNGLFTVAGITANEAKVEIVNAIGQMVYSNNNTVVINGSVSVNATLVPGSYILKLGSGDAEEVVRFSVY